MSAQIHQGLLKFPATPEPSADVNTLDAYEEGVWTPIINRDNGGWSGVYTSRVGTYVKVGKLVTLNAKIVIASISNASSGMNIIQGLPAYYGSTDSDGIGAVGNDSALTSDVKSVRMNGSMPWIELVSSTGATISENWAVGTLEFTLTYIASS